MPLRKWLWVVCGIVALSAFVGCSSTGTKSEKRKRSSESTQPTVASPTKSTGDTDAQLASDNQQLYQRALAAMQSTQDATAEPLLEKVVKAQPTFSAARANLGIVQYRAGRYARAEEEFKQAIKDDPRNLVAYNYLGIVYRINGQFQQSKAIYEQALTINPNYANALLNLGILYDLYLRDLNKALETYQQYQKLQPQEDKDVAKWMADLKRRIDKGK